MEEHDVMSQLQDDQTYTFNIGGSKFETTISTLQKHPHTKLAKFDVISEFYRPNTGEYFLDRDPDVFKAVLNFYRMGELHVPMGVCGQVFQRELEFWEIDENNIEQCCWGSYHAFKQRKEVLTKMEAALKSCVTDMMKPIKDSKRKEFMRKGWIFLEDPSSSLGAKVFSVISALVILLSVTSFCLATEPSLQRDLSAKEWTDLFGPESNSSRSHLNKTSPTSTDTSTALTPTMASRLEHNASTVALPTHEDYQAGSEFRYLNNTGSRDYKVSSPVFDYISFFCSCFFFVDIIIRILFAPKKLAYLRHPLTVIELVTQMGSLLVELIYAIDPLKQNVIRNGIGYFETLLQILRVFRLFRTLRHYKGALIIAHTFRASLQELALMTVFLAITVLISGSIMYHIDDPKVFTSILKSFWWSLVTLTTVGYGDMVPSTTLGYMVGSLCVLSGVLVIAFTLPVIVSNFVLYYGHMQSRPNGKRRTTETNCEQLETEAMASTNLSTFSLSASIVGKVKNSSRNPPRFRRQSMTAIEPTNTGQSSFETSRTTVANRVVTLHS